MTFGKISQYPKRQISYFETLSGNALITKTVFLPEKANKNSK
jgi:hypothetical protein